MQIAKEHSAARLSCGNNATSRAFLIAWATWRSTGLSGRSLPRILPRSEMNTRNVGVLVIDALDAEAGEQVFCWSFARADLAVSTSWPSDTRRVSS